MPQRRIGAIPHRVNGPSRWSKVEKGHEMTGVSTKVEPAPKQTLLPIDVESLTRRCVNNRKLAAKALRMFDAGIDRDLALLAKGVTEADAQAVAASAHKIKGAAANISAESVRQMAAQLEKMGREDALHHSQLTLDQLKYEVDALRQYLGTAIAHLVPADPGKPSAV
jgi:HPt (histidine-containing phosphotransfer) domain-containing protein